MGRSSDNLLLPHKKLKATIRRYHEITINKVDGKSMLMISVRYGIFCCTDRREPTFLMGGVR
ncbi:hypothetical protein TY87_10070 [Marinomonas sp. BSi20584]|nr:hypothetical protein TY87_10070 [Marinomonas sp. BSi20584]